MIPLILLCLSTRLYHRASKFDCPRCLENMRECVYQSHRNLLIDSCRNGCGVFFEQGEVRRAIKLNHDDD
jgi:Zn-finger nucleic acid-binding protein